MLPPGVYFFPDKP